KDREELCQQTTGDRPLHRVGLVCDAGLGKTTNLQWLAAHLAGRGERQLPLLLDLKEDLDLLIEERKPGRPSEALAHRLAKLIEDKAGGDPRRHLSAIRRLQASGRITLLIDGLDHVTATGRLGTLLRELLDSQQWRPCPAWIAGRPSAFEACWHKLFN